MSSSSHDGLELIKRELVPIVSRNSLFPRRYGCNIKTMLVLSRDARVEEVTGEHKPGHSDLDVVALFAFNTGSRYLPKRLGFVFPNLTTLKITKSQLRLIEFRDFHNMRRLKELLLTENRIEKIPACLFRYADNIEEIDFSGNRIKVLHEDTFVNLPNLQSFAINNNALKRVHQGTFANNVNLKRLEMQHNNLSIIEVNFMRIKAIDVIDLRNNFCISLSFTSSKGMPLREFMNSTSANCKGPEVC
jgi:Leucine rich repeat